MMGKRSMVLTIRKYPTILFDERVDREAGGICPRCSKLISRAV